MGFNKVFKNLDGQEISVQNNSEVTQQGQQIRIPRKGFEDRNRGVRGDLVVIVSIEMPRNLSPQQLEGNPGLMKNWPVFSSQLTIYLINNSSCVSNMQFERNKFSKPGSTTRSLDTRSTSCDKDEAPVRWKYMIKTSSFDSRLPRLKAPLIQRKDEKVDQGDGLGDSKHIEAVIEEVELEVNIPFIQASI